MTAPSVHSLADMIRIRVLEERCAELYGRMKIRGFLHLAVGEEAIAAGIIPQLKADDAMLATYRGLLARIRSQGPAGFGHRVRLSRWQKLRIATHSILAPRQLIAANTTSRKVGSTTTAGEQCITAAATIDISGFTTHQIKTCIGGSLPLDTGSDIINVIKIAVIQYRID